jgi:hypothetical protein
VARGVTEGNIMAAIMDVHIVTKVINDIPIVPGIIPIECDWSTVAIQAITASTNKMEVNSVIPIILSFLIPRNHCLDQVGFSPTG